MAENLYEGMFLLDSGKFAANPDGMSADLVALLEKAGATVEAHRPWQDGRLAYEIEGRRKGLHYLTYFRLDPAAITRLTRACKLSDMVLRHMFIKQPESLFDAMINALTGGESAGEETEEAAATEEKPAAEKKEETVAVGTTDEGNSDD